MPEFKGSRIARFAEHPGQKQDQFVFQGEEFKFAAYPNGEAFIECLYPNPEEAEKKCRHYAIANSRPVQDAQGNPVPYPFHLWGTVKAIQLSYVREAGEEEVPEGTVLALFDSNPRLFDLMQASAFEVLGLSADSRLASGIQGWLGMKALLRAARGLCKKGDASKVDDLLRQGELAVRGALKEFTLDPGIIGVEEDVDPMIRGMEGNSPELAAS